MALNFQHVPVNFAGLDQKVDPRKALPGQLVTAQNVFMDKTGRMAKRPGFSALSLPTGKTVGYDGITSYNGGIEGASAGLQAAFYPVRDWSSVVVFEAADYAETDAIAEAMLEGPYLGQGIRVSQHDPVSRAQFAELTLETATAASSIYWVRVLSIGSALWEFYALGQTLKLRVTTGGATTTYTVAATDIATTNKFVDAEVDETGATVCIVYNDAAGDFVARLIPVATPGAGTKYTLSSAAPATDHVSVSTTGTKAGTQYFYVAWTTGTDLQSRRITTGGTLSAAVAVKASGYATGDMLQQNGPYVLWWDATGPAVGAPNTWGSEVYEVDHAAGSSAQVARFPGIMPLGRGWQDGTYRYWIVQNHGLAADVTNQCAAVLRQTIADDTFVVLGSFWDGYTRLVSDSGTTIQPACGMFNQRRIYGAGNYPERIQQTLGRFEGGYGFQTVEFSDRSTVQYAELRGQLSFVKNLNPQLSGGIVWPTCAPAPVQGLSGSGSGSLTALATYSYVVTLVWYDALGREWESAPSVPAAYTLTGTDDQILGTVWAYPFLEETDITSINYRVYRTAGNGSLHYLLFELPLTAAAIALNDTTADSAITGNRILYTESGEVENRGGPAADYLLATRGRLWAISAEDGSVWVTKQRGNNLGSSFSLSLVVNAYSIEKPVALADLDDKTLLFTQNEVYALYGDGPDNLGQGAFTVQRLPHTVGCRDARSVVTTEYGVFFMSEKGIYVIDRGLNLQYVGAQVEDQNANTILAAFALDERHEVWFAYAAGVLVFDTYHKQWFTRTGLTIADATMHQNKPVLSTGAALLTEGAVYTDSGANYATVIETGWIAFGQFVGFQRLRKIILPVSGRKGCVVEVWYDNDNSGAAAETFTIADAATDYFEIEMKPQVQKCESIKIRITHTSATSGQVLHGIVFEAGVKRGSHRLPDANRTEGS